ncbi:hypothetical protein [Natronobiforma cellulositropha]|uniref:hypothetical protein n=1 Tax=Natronobiforma cellulositropha TaxID=1679076 RepID=UPI0021D60575|nr:hypothetical protein [Natronobiforma cellulositropha]
MTSDDPGALDAVDGDSSASDPTLEDERTDEYAGEDDLPSLDRGLAAMVACLVGVLAGSMLPWAVIDGTVVYGFEVYGWIAVVLAAAAGGVAHAFEWDRRAMAVLFLAGVVVAAFALTFLPFGGIGVLVTALSGGTLAFLAAGRFSKLGLADAA